MITVVIAKAAGLQRELANPSIEAVGLSKRYGQFAALSDLSLKVEGTKCVGLLGSNGAGKTTTLKIFTDMVRPSEGVALINGVSVRENKREALEACGTLIESPEIYPSLTSHQALSMVAELRGVPRAERDPLVSEAIAEVKMTEWEDKKIGKLSKGMKQRVNIAAALICKPEVVLLDEPTTGLDPGGMSDVREIVKSLKSKGRLIFMSSHLLNEVEDVCDEVAIIDRGRLLVYDTLENVTARFSGRESVTTIEIELSRPLLDEPKSRGVISSLPGVISVARSGAKGLRLRFSGGAETRERLLKELGGLDIGMTSFRTSTSALEESYLNLVEGKGDLS